MTIIVIKDLPESVDLDRQAMAAIAGGARTGSRQIFAGGTIFRSTRIVNYPARVSGTLFADVFQPPRRIPSPSRGGLGS